MAGLTDVDITSIADGDAIVYDSTATKYVNKALSIDDLSDVAITTPADGEVIEYDEATTTWKNATNA